MAEVGRTLRGTLRPPGDKSVAHRAALIASLARGVSEIARFPRGDDCRRTLDLLRALGVPVAEREDTVRITGRGYFRHEAPPGDLDAGNSGSTMRMACGLLAGQPFESRLTGDPSLSRRPMGRVIEPLERMGARIESAPGGRAPLTVRGGRRLLGGDHDLLLPSAQVKTALILAALHAEGASRVREPLPSRDHTERLLGDFGLTLGSGDGWIEIPARAPLDATRLRLPGDISSAAFFIVGAAILPGSDLRIEDVGLNPTRTGLLDVLRSMSAAVEVEAGEPWGAEPVGSLRIRGGELHGVEVPPESIPRLIDEVPILAVAAAFASGETVIRGAGELRVKESDRLSAVAGGLRAMGVEVSELPDGMVIRGGAPRRPAKLSSGGDHRMAMAWAVAALAAGEACEIEGAEAVGVSYPGFFRDLDRLAA